MNLKGEDVAIGLVEHYEVLHLGIAVGANEVLQLRFRRGTTV